MIICGLQIGHEPSVCIVKDGKLIWYNEEKKLARDKKIEGIPFNCIDELIKLKIKINQITVTSYNHEGIELKTIDSYFKHKNLINKNHESLSWFTPHHVNHLFKAYIDSGFKKARVFVIDGRGSNWYLNDNQSVYETTSVFDIDEDTVECIYKKLFRRKKITKGLSININYNPNYNVNGIEKVKPPLVTDKTIFEITNDHDLGHYYQRVSRAFGYNHEEGKFMGLTSYGKVNKKLNVKDINKLNINLDTAATCQKYFEDSYLNLVKKFKYKNMIFTGGTGLNVVNNYKIKQNFKECNLYFEPLCGDEGNSIGSVYSYLYSQRKNITPLKNIYIGSTIKTNNKLLDNEYFINNIGLNEIINILNKGEVVGLIQGKAEAGPRALGNRSLLLDPTILQCKNIMNEIKKREKFRPFAISIDEKYIHDYFYNMEKSPYMMYAPQAKLKAKKQIPGVIHIDGTCRVQTVNAKSNFILYNLLNKFKVPILMNTSFNLAGFPMVESFEDVLYSVRNSNINYVYFADENKLLVKN